MDDKKILEERLNNIVETLESIEDYVNNLDINIPQAAKDLIVKTVQSDEIKEIVDGIKEKRPPRLALVGRSGVGKSSLINALMGSYVAETSAVQVGTLDTKVYQYEKDGEVIFEVIDTRGFSEDQQATSISAEEELKNTIKEFNPDAFLMLTNAADRSSLKSDATLLKKYSEKLKVNVPLITVITRVDALSPSRIKEPHLYSDKKKSNIREKVKQVKSVLKEEDVSNAYVIPVSTYIEWSHEEPDELTEEERQKLHIEFDGRYNIDKLIEYLEDNMDFRASVYMLMNKRLDQAIKQIANRFVKVFSTTSAGIAATPIPASDIFVLVPIQILEVTMIAYLTGTKLDAKAARDFIMSLGGVTLAGIGFRFVAQQGSKFMNLVIPGSGSAISSGVAYSGTFAIGKAAIAYYIDGKSTEEAKKELGNNQEAEVLDDIEEVIENQEENLDELPTANLTEDEAEHYEEVVEDAKEEFEKELEEIDESPEEESEEEEKKPNKVFQKISNMYKKKFK